MGYVVADPETDPRATYAIDPGRVRALTARVVASGEGGTTTTHTPLTGAPLAVLPVSTAADVAEAVERARVAQARWADVPHTVLTPHTAGGTLESIPQMVAMTLENLRRYFHGEPLATPVAA